MKVSVLVPTFRRAESLRRCLSGIRLQVRAADEVLIVIQKGDEESALMLAEWSEWPELRVIAHAASGQVAQLNVGLDEATGDVIAITDDDAIPRPDWLQRIEAHFATQQDLGGVGGRDYVIEDGVALVGDANMIGTVQWFGRVVGNHHLGGRLRPNVDCLKGANMSFRAAALHDQRFDTDLLGKGAQTCNDWAFSLRLKKRGWRLLYDPAVAIDHFPAKRHDADQRSAPSSQALQDSSFNYYLSIRRHMKRGLRRNMAIAWAFLIGVENSPGVVRAWVSRRKNSGVQKKYEVARLAWHACKVICAHDDLNHAATLHATKMARADREKYSSQK